jgi:predicted Zn-dependent protease
VYGLALAQRRARDYAGSWKTLEPLRAGSGSHPAFELLAGQLLNDQGQSAQALDVYRAALRTTPSYRALVYAYLELQLATGHANEVVADLDQRLRAASDDYKLYEIQARAYAATNRQIAQHRAQAEAHLRRGNLGAAVEQLEIAVRLKSNDFYEISSAESRLRELRAQLEIERAAEKALKIS